MERFSFFSHLLSYQASLVQNFKTLLTNGKQNVMFAFSFIPVVHLLEHDTSYDMG